MSVELNPDFLLRKGLILVMLCINTALFAAPSPVLLFLSKQDQPDSLGYNLVAELPGIAYKEIMSGRVPLWDSPEKTLQIKPATLKRLEESAADSFVHSKQLFIYELWDLDAKKGSFSTVGFYFSNRSERGVEISYGFVEYTALDSALSRNFIRMNANGQCRTTFSDVLTERNYSFNIVQIGDKKVKSVNEALSYKKLAASLISSLSKAPEYNCKDILFRIDHRKSEHSRGDEKAAVLLKSVQTFLNENREVFYNLGGDRIKSFLAPQKISVTSIDVMEEWSLSKEVLQSKTLGIIIYTEGEALNFIAEKDLAILDCVVYFRSVRDFLNDKEFSFTLMKINEQIIEPEKSPSYLKALRSWKWNGITEFVKYD